jgi:acetyl-CoA synthetase
MQRIQSLEHYKLAYRESIENPEAFWAEIASDLQWQKKWDRVLDWNFDPYDCSWFIGGKINITENCLDRHLTERGDHTAIVFEPNNPNDAVRRISYRELYVQVCKFANVLNETACVRATGFVCTCQ